MGKNGHFCLVPKPPVCLWSIHYVLLVRIRGLAPFRMFESKMTSWSYSGTLPEKYAIRNNFSERTCTA